MYSLFPDKTSLTTLGYRYALLLCQSYRNASDCLPKEPQEEKADFNSATTATTTATSDCQRRFLRNVSECSSTLVMAILVIVVVVLYDYYSNVRAQQRKSRREAQLDSYWIQYLLQPNSMLVTMRDLIPIGEQDEKQEQRTQGSNNKNDEIKQDASQPLTKAKNGAIEQDAATTPRNLENDSNNNNNDFNPESFLLRLQMDPSQRNKPNTGSAAEENHKAPCSTKTNSDQSPASKCQDVMNNTDNDKKASTTIPPTSPASSFSSSSSASSSGSSSTHDISNFCPICWEDFAEGSWVCWSRCHNKHAVPHVFHVNCMTQHVQTCLQAHYTKQEQEQQEQLYLFYLPAVQPAQQQQQQQQSNQGKDADDKITIECPLCRGPFLRMPQRSS